MLMIDVSQHQAWTLADLLDLGSVLSVGTIKWRWELSHHLEQDSQSLTRTHKPSPRSFDSSIYVTPSPFLEEKEEVVSSTVFWKINMNNSTALQRDQWGSAGFPLVLIQEQTQGEFEPEWSPVPGSWSGRVRFGVFRKWKVQELAEVTGTQLIIYQPFSKHAEMFWNWASSAIFFCVTKKKRMLIAKNFPECLVAPASWWGLSSSHWLIQFSPPPSEVIICDHVHFTDGETEP